MTRHARARTATVRVAYGDGLSIEVADDGVGGTVAARADAGGTAARSAGNGITGMRERAAALGGRSRPVPGRAAASGSQRPAPPADMTADQTMIPP